MPYIQIRLNSPSPIDHPHLAREVTRLLAELLGKHREVTVVEIIPGGAWYAAGEPVHGPAAYVDIKITQGTNSAAEKARLLAACQALLSDSLGKLAAPAYVVIHEIPAGDWGYDGLPQAARMAGRL